MFIILLKNFPETSELRLASRHEAVIAQFVCPVLVYSSYAAFITITIGGGRTIYSDAKLGTGEKGRRGTHFMEGRGKCLRRMVKYLNENKQEKRLL